MRTLRTNRRRIFECPAVPKNSVPHGSDVPEDHKNCLHLKLNPRECNLSGSQSGIGHPKRTCFSSPQLWVGWYRKKIVSWMVDRARSYDHDTNHLVLRSACGCVRPCYHITLALFLSLLVSMVLYALDKTARIVPFMPFLEVFSGGNFRFVKLEYGRG